MTCVQNEVHVALTGWFWGLWPGRRGGLFRWVGWRVQAMACWVTESIRAEPNQLAEVEQIAEAANIPSTLAQDYEEARAKKLRKSKAKQAH